MRAWRRAAVHTHMASSSVRPGPGPEARSRVASIGVLPGGRSPSGPVAVGGRRRAAGRRPRGGAAAGTTPAASAPVWGLGVRLA